MATLNRLDESPRMENKFENECLKTNSNKQGLDLDYVKQKIRDIFDSISYFFSCCCNSPRKQKQYTSTLVSVQENLQLPRLNINLTRTQEKDDAAAFEAEAVMIESDTNPSQPVRDISQVQGQDKDSFSYLEWQDRSIADLFDSEDEEDEFDVGEIDWEDSNSKSAEAPSVTTKPVNDDQPLSSISSQSERNINHVQIEEDWDFTSFIQEVNSLVTDPEIAALFLKLEPEDSSDLNLSEELSDKQTTVSISGLDFSGFDHIEMDQSHLQFSSSPKLDFSAFDHMEIDQSHSQSSSSDPESTGIFNGVEMSPKLDSPQSSPKRLSDAAPLFENVEMDSRFGSESN